MNFSSHTCMPLSPPDTNSFQSESCQPKLLVIPTFHMPGVLWVCFNPRIYSNYFHINCQLADVGNRTETRLSFIRRRFFDSTEIGLLVWSYNEWLSNYLCNHNKIINLIFSIDTHLLLKCRYKSIVFWHLKFSSSGEFAQCAASFGHSGMKAEISASETRRLWILLPSDCDVMLTLCAATNVLPKRL